MRCRLLFLSFLSIFTFVSLFLVDQSYAGSVTLGATSGVPGQEITITGTAFDTSSTVTFLFDGSAMTTTPSTVSTNGSGAFPPSGNVSFIVPSASFGTHTMKISTSSNNFAIATFTINTASIAVTSPAIPTAGLPVGSILTITGSNFEANKTTTIYIDDTSIGTATTSYNGSFNATITIPNVNNTGTHILKASNSAFSVANTTITIATPALTLSPSTAVVGQSVAVTGTNFRPGSTLGLTYNGSEFSPALSVTANGAGSFATTFTVPDLIQGTATVKATDTTFSQLFAIATQTVSTPAITLTPSTAASGTLINVVGTNFKASSTVTFYVGDALLTLSSGSSTVTSNAQGGFVTTFTAPSGTGAVVIKAYNNSILIATSTLTLSTSTLTVTPSSGPDNIKVQLTGTNFGANSDVTLYFNGKKVKSSDFSEETSQNGGFAAYFKLPNNLPPGAYTLKAETGSLDFATATYTVSTPSVSLSVSSGTPGARVIVTGSNFSPNNKVSLKWNGSPLTPVEKELKVGHAGGFVANINIPSSYTPGANQIEVNVEEDFALATFTVSAPTLTVSPSTNTSGGKFTIAGSNFDGGQTLIFKFDDVVLDTSPASVKTTPLGGFFAVSTIPDSTRGTHFLTVSTAKGDVLSSASIIISSPTVSVSTSSSVPGYEVVINGQGFNPDSKLMILWNGDTELNIKSITTDASGSFSGDIYIPKDANIGRNTIVFKTSDKVNATVNYVVTDENVLGVTSENVDNEKEKNSDKALPGSNEKKEGFNLKNNALSVSLTGLALALFVFVLNKFGVFMLFKK